MQEQVRSGDASATELFELGAVMLRRKVYPAATKFLLEAIQKWDGDDQDLAQVWYRFDLPNLFGSSWLGTSKHGIITFYFSIQYARFTMPLVSVMFEMRSLRKESSNLKLLWRFNQAMSQPGITLVMHMRRKKTTRLHSKHLKKYYFLILIIK